jgi:hypothetical protein
MIVVTHAGAAELPFQILTPTDMCCNCGSPSGTSSEEVKLKHTRYLFLAGTELTLKVMLPFCETCKSTANRYRQGLFSKTLIAFVITWVVFGGLLVMPTAWLPALIRENLFTCSFTLAALLTVGFFASRRATAPKTSVYQPVFLDRLQQAFAGGIRGLVLGFTNHQYAAAFARANRDLVKAGTLVVKKV